MDFVEETVDIIHCLARKNSEGDEIDQYWKPVLSDVSQIAENEIFLTLHRWYINESMKADAAQYAQNVPLPDVTDLDDATLYLHCWMRVSWLGIGDDPKFQSYVDNHLKGFIHPPEPVYWVNVSGVLLPISEGTVRQIYFALVERYKQFRFDEHCWDELMDRIRADETRMHMTLLLNCSEFFPVERNRAYQWLHDQNADIEINVREDSMHDCLRKMLELPPHIQVQRNGAILKAIRDRVIDMMRKGGQYENVPFDDQLANAISDESAVDPNQSMIADEFLPRLLECRTQIEKVLGKGKPKLAKRRFQVMEMLAHTSCQKTIAQKLNISESTITRDIQIIEKSGRQIRHILYARRTD